MINTNFRQLKQTSVNNCNCSQKEIESRCTWKTAPGEEHKDLGLVLKFLERREIKGKGEPKTMTFQRAEENAEFTKLNAFWVVCVMGEMWALWEEKGMGIQWGIQFLCVCFDSNSTLKNYPNKQHLGIFLISYLLLSSFSSPFGIFVIFCSPSSLVKRAYHVVWKISPLKKTKILLSSWSLILLVGISVLI